MKSNELCIGNWINIYDDYNAKVTGMTNTNKVWFVKNTHDDGCAVNIHQIKPIPLTEEWLLKVGFESKGYDEEYNYYTKDNFTMLKDYGLQGVAIPTKKNKKGYVHLYCGYYNNEIDFEYVHQLQNLYFALTNTELIFNK